MIEKQVIFEGILREEEEQSNETARLLDYRMAAITKDATYVLIDALPYDFIVTMPSIGSQRRSMAQSISELMSLLAGS